MRTQIGSADILTGAPPVWSTPYIVRGSSENPTRTGSGGKKVCVRPELGSMPAHTSMRRGRFKIIPPGHVFAGIADISVGEP